MRRFLAALLVLASSHAHADPAATAVLERSRATYAALTSYQDDGVVEQESQWDLPFKTMFARPDRLRFEWTARHPFFLASFSKISSTILADGHRVLYHRVSYDDDVDDRTMPTLSDAVASGTGVSSGSVHHTATLLIPDLFAGQNFGGSVLAAGDPQHGGVESVDGVRCDHVSGVTKRGVKLDVWIGADDHLVRRVDTDDGPFKSSELHRHIRVDRPVPAAAFTSVASP